MNKLNFKPEKVRSALIKSLRNESPQVRINAIEVLMNSEDPQAEDLIRGMLEDRNQEVVQNAVIALYNMIGDSVLTEILNNETATDFAKIEALKLQEHLKECEEDDEIEE